MLEFETPKSAFSENLYDLILRAPVEPTLWTQVLELISQQIGASGALVFFTPPQQSLGHVATGVVKDVYSKYLLGGFHLLDIRDLRVSKMSAPHFVTEERLISPTEFERHPLYADFLLRIPGGRHAAAADMPKPGERVGVHFERDHRLPAFAPEAVKWLDSLFPHFMRALHLASRSEHSRMRGVVSALGSLGIPAAFVTFAARIQASNSAFDDVLPRFFGRSGDVLTFDESENSNRIRRAIRAFETHWMARFDSQKAASLPLIDPAGGRGHILHIMRNVEGPQSLTVSLLLMITPVGEAKLLSPQLIEFLFGLTGSEALIAHEIGSGNNVSDIAASRQVSEHTVRSHMKAIYSKLEISRQIELARMLQQPFTPFQSEG